MSLSAIASSLAEPTPPFVAIPVFPSRVFRHSSIYVSTAAGIEAPSDLKGRRVGVPHYPMTAAVWSYHHEQGFSADRHSAEELFAAEARTT